MSVQDQCSLNKLFQLELSGSPHNPHSPSLGYGELDGEALLLIFIFSGNSILDKDRLTKQIFSHAKRGHSQLLYPTRNEEGRREGAGSAQGYAHRPTGTWENSSPSTTSFRLKLWLTRVGCAC